MADALYELLSTQAGGTANATEPQLPTPPEPVALEYLTWLVSQPLSSLESKEPQALSQASHSLQISLQALSKKAHKPIIESAAHHATLTASLPALVASVAELRSAIPKLDSEAVRFSTTYHNRPSEPQAEHALLARRRRALLLARNVERLVDVLELPTLLASAIAAAPVNYSSALDLNGHVRRLHGLYPASALVGTVAAEADDAMRAMAASLVLALKAPGLRLAAALRTISWLRRVLPDLEDGLTASSTSGTGTGTGTGSNSSGSDAAAAQERVLGALFLVCRLATLLTTLDALAPLRELADQEKARQRSLGSGNVWSGGQQTERYLKRYIEIFREQSFAIVSMFRSIFPAAAATASAASAPGEADVSPLLPTSPRLSGLKTQMPRQRVGDDGGGDDLLQPLPSALSTFPLHLVDMLLETLRVYLPTVKDQASRDSLLTQVLYCAASLGRLGSDFGLFLAGLDVGSDAEEEWVEVVKRHRQLAGRLESIVGDQKERKGST